MKLVFTITFIYLVISFKTLAQNNEDETLSLPSEPTKSDSEKNSAKVPSEEKKKLSPGPKKEKNDVGAVLDFEGEVIEGERRRPDLFLQISIDNVKFDSLIYNREDFNDYLESDRKSRNKFFKMK